MPKYAKKKPKGLSTALWKKMRLGSPAARMRQTTPKRSLQKNTSKGILNQRVLKPSPCRNHAKRYQLCQWQAVGSAIGSYRSMMEHVNIMADTRLNRLPLWELLSCSWMLSDVAALTGASRRNERVKATVQAAWGGGGMLPAVACFDSNWSPGLRRQWSKLGLNTEIM